MVVHQIENGDNPEFEQLYEQIDANEAQSNCKAKDKAISKIIEEDLFFENNKLKLDCNSNKIDLELLQKYKGAQYLDQRLRIINRRWKHSTNTTDHAKITKCNQKPQNKK